MKTNVKNVIVCILMAAVMLVLSVIFVFGPKSAYLESERREPTAFPEVSYESIMKDGVEYSDSFMSKFEKYALDAFPFFVSIVCPFY